MAPAFGRAFDRVLILMFENQYRSYVMENPYFRNLAKRGLMLRNYFGCFHPSQTNYIASTAGEVCNVTDDDPPPALLKQRTLVDLVEASSAGLNWKGYMDGFVPQMQPWTPELKPADNFPYVIKHNPYSSFESIVRNQERWARVQDEAAFWADVLNGTLPNYAWFTPDMWNDGHYLNGTHTDPPERAPALVDQAALWLESFFDRLRFPGPDSHLPEGTLVVVTFDEADFEADWEKGEKYTYDGPNQIYTVLLGDGIEPGVCEVAYNHYSLIRTIEKNFDLGHLGKNDTHANWFRFLWGERFQWFDEGATPLGAAAGLAAASFAGSLYVVETDGDGAMRVRTCHDDDWHSPQPLPFKGSSPVLAADQQNLLLTFTDPGGDRVWSRYTLQDGWSAAASFPAGNTAQVSMVTMDSGRIMAAYRGAGDAIYSVIFSDGAWADPVATGASTAGDLVLTRLGATLLLVYQAPGSEDALAALSYNTADCNVVTYPEGSKWAGPYDDTVKDAWAKTAFPVAHFAHGPNATTPGEAEPLLRPYAGGRPLTAATLDGVIHLIHPGRANTQLLTESFSLSGIMTPKLAISYAASDETTTSNGYGSLAQAGWSHQTAVPGAYARDLAVAATHDGAVYLFHRVGGDDDVHLTIGCYAE
ncbi:alkaline phosphatase family protein [Acanthopleuribacter pedis]|uniref:Phosphoesterase n=1 Tax=Acanthopleuribacter pedis TaxID=442870 RepID=A0A8J7QGI0_9BACT|nr:alkaline phosphatase family protein [Acanthopleuribacter pedis]MBO1318218.1 hypothetical protein [Acanthopleuribacter pedis]